MTTEVRFAVICLISLLLAGCETPRVTEREVIAIDQKYEGAGCRLEIPKRDFRGDFRYWGSQVVTYNVVRETYNYKNTEEAFVQIVEEVTSRGPCL